MMLEADGLVERFAPIGLQEADGARLLNRVDTKFLLSEDDLARVLVGLDDHYDMLSIEGRRFSHYRTVYFDTPDFMLYHQHHNDHQNRYKVRCRKYLDTDNSFLEVKLKTNKRRTVKNRLEVADLLLQLGSESGTFLDYHYPLSRTMLEPVIWNSFQRATLVGKTRRERVTIDVDLAYGWGVREGRLSNIGIVEVKQLKFDPNSPLVHNLRAERIRPMGFSKYCAAMMEIYPYIKRNRFKRRSLVIQRLQQRRGPQ